MKEIKFRAWNGKVLSYDSLEAGKEVYLTPGTKEIQLFTGLKDKNGKEIYEGDIISFGDYSDGSGKCLHQVIWNDEDAKFDSRELYFEKGSFGLDPFAEVIGNIYENPELLEKK